VLLVAHIYHNYHRPLMGSSTVNTLTPLVGTLGGVAAIGSLLRRGEATTIDDEVDAPIVEV
jgi:hypothetical protein